MPAAAAQTPPVVAYREFGYTMHQLDTRLVDITQLNALVGGVYLCFKLLIKLCEVHRVEVYKIRQAYAIKLTQLVGQYRVYFGSIIQHS
ncbi:hypothetical protein D9M68_949300 [compost metagenome]